MFDTMTLTKIAAGVFGAWLVLLLGKWAGEEIYHADAHGEASYVIEVADAGGAGDRFRLAPTQQVFQLPFGAPPLDATIDQGRDTG